MNVETRMSDYLTCGRRLATAADVVVSA